MSCSKSKDLDNMDSKLEVAVTVNHPFLYGMRRVDCTVGCNQTEEYPCADSHCYYNAILYGNSMERSHCHCKGSSSIEWIHQFATEAYGFTKHTFLLENVQRITLLLVMI